MDESSRKSGIDIVGDVRWGMHLCQFYQTKEDLTDILVPYFKAGLENNEFCMWVTSEPLRVEEARASLGEAVKDLDKYFAKGQVEILDYSEWYTESGRFDADVVLQGWVDKERQALEKGFNGLRLTENTFWLQREDWADFTLYEGTVDSVIGQHKIIAICTYSLEKCKSIPEVIDVTSNHEFALIRREGQWKTIEGARRRQGTNELANNEAKWRSLVQNAPNMIMETDCNGTIQFMNRTPPKFDVKEEVGKSIYDYIQQEHHNVVRKAIDEVTRTGKNSNYELTGAGPDGSISWYRTTISPIRHNGETTSLIHIMDDITERKRAEERINVFSSAVAGAIDGIAITDMKGAITYANLSMEKLFGYNNGEMLGKSVVDLAANQEMANGIIPTLIKTGSWSGEIESIKKNKETFPAILSLSIVSDEKGNPIATMGSVRDITERRQAEDELQRTEENLRHIIERSADGIIIVDRDGIMRLVNPAAENLFKHKAQELVSGFFGFPIVAGETTELDIVRPGGEPTIAEMRVVYTDWERRPAYLASLRDVTERKQAEEELRRSEERYSILVEQSNDAIIVIQDGLMKFASGQKSTEMTGFSLEEILGKPFLNFIALEWRDSVADRYKKRIAGEEVPDRYEIEIVHKDGRKIPIEVSASVIEYEGKLADMAVLRDISERKQAEKQLKAQKELTDRILASTPNPVVVINHQFLIELANKAFYEFFKIEKEEAEGRSVSDVLLTEGLPEAISKVFANGEPQLNLEFTYGAGTDERIFIGQLLPMLKEEEALLILQDVTTERNMQQQLYHSRTLASVGEMASGVAHEINNPLTAVIGFAQLLAQKDLPEDIREDVNIINNEAQRVASIVKGLLTFARQRKPERGYINVNDVIQLTLNLRKYELKTGNIELATQLDPELPGTMADAGQLQQVFLNILINAEAAMKSAHGKGKLFVKTEKIEDTIRISFNDDGPGIAKENMDKLFNPFFTTKKVGEGTGLGLSICHGIVTEHNGRIYARSELGKGATFIVELPIINQAKQSELSRSADDKSRNVTGARILVVDDEELVRQYLNRLLTDEGFEVQCTDNADDALDKLKNNRYSLILLNIKMPGTSGIEMYRRLPEIAQSLTRRVVFMTGDVMTPDTKDFLSATKAPYINKPFSIEQLKREIGRILDHGK